MKAEDQQVLLTAAMTAALRDGAYHEQLGATMRTHTSTAIRVAIIDAMKDPAVIKAWAPTLARSVSKGVFFGVLALAFLCFCIWFMLPHPQLSIR